MKKLCIVSALVSVALAALYAQQKGSQGTPAAKVEPSSPIPDNRIVLDVNRVNMLFTVSDKKGRFITNLTKDDFEIFEHKKPQTIVEFAAESDLPLRLGVVIDTSNSIRERFKFQQEAAVEFVNSVMRPQ